MPWPTPENGARIIRALDLFGFGSLGLTADDFRKPGQVVQLGVPPIRVDLITSMTGVSWEQAEAGKVPGGAGGPCPMMHDKLVLPAGD